MVSFKLILNIFLSQKISYVWILFYAKCKKQFYANVSTLHDRQCLLKKASMEWTTKTNIRSHAAVTHLISAVVDLITVGV